MFNEKRKVLRKVKTAAVLAICLSMFVTCGIWADEVQNQGKNETVDIENEEAAVDDHHNQSDNVDIEPTPEDSYTLIQQFVIRLYKNILNRDADKHGLDDWTQGLVSGEYTGAKVAEGFIYSQELERRQLSDESYVNMLYETFLNRKADDTGKKDWLNMLENGVSRTFVFKGFVESAEFTDICSQFGIVRGNVVLTQPKDKNPDITMFVWRCYRKVLGRDADNVGLNAWTEKLISKEISAGETAYGFVFSEEMFSKQMSDREFIEMLYEVCLGRKADNTGRRDWMNKLYYGTSRCRVFLGFVYSDEFKNICNGYGITVGVLPEPKDSKEDVVKAVQNYFNSISNYEGDYVVYPFEVLEKRNSYQMVVRYYMSDDEYNRVVSAGGSPATGIMIGTVNVDKGTGIASADQYGMTWRVW